MDSMPLAIQLAHENMWKTSVHSPLKGYLYTFLWTVNNSSDPQICAAQKYFTGELELRSSESKQTMNQISHRMEELWDLTFMKCTNSKDRGAVYGLMPLIVSTGLTKLYGVTHSHLFTVSTGHLRHPLESPDDGVGSCIKGISGVIAHSCTLTWLKQWFVCFLHLCLSSVDVLQW